MSVSQTHGSGSAAAGEKPKVRLLNDPKFRSYIFQGVLVVFLAWLVWSMVNNAAINLKNAGVASGFWVSLKSCWIWTEFFTIYRL